MTNTNAFWHIVGDALGFRRGFLIGGRTEIPDFIRPHILHAEAVGRCGSSHVSDLDENITIIYTIISATPPKYFL